MDEVWHERERDRGRKSRQELGKRKRRRKTKQERNEITDYRYINCNPQMSPLLTRCPV